MTKEKNTSFCTTGTEWSSADWELQLFGIDRMLETLNKDTGASPGKILENVCTAVSTFVKDAEQFDGLTMLCVEYKGTKES